MLGITILTTWGKVETLQIYQSQKNEYLDRTEAQKNELWIKLRTKEYWRT